MTIETVEIIETIILWVVIPLAGFVVFWLLAE